MDNEVTVATSGNWNNTVETLTTNLPSIRVNYIFEHTKTSIPIERVHVLTNAASHANTLSIKYHSIWMITWIKTTLAINHTRPFAPRFSSISAKRLSESMIKRPLSSNSCPMYVASLSRRISTPDCSK